MCSIVYWELEFTVCNFEIYQFLSSSKMEIGTEL